MTALQLEVLALLTKQIIKAIERANKVSDMNDLECQALIPLVQANIDANDETIQGL